jgi:hypothetical protein
MPTTFMQVKCTLRGWDVFFFCKELCKQLSRHIQFPSNGHSFWLYCAQCEWVCVYIQYTYNSAAEKSNFFTTIFFSLVYSLFFFIFFLEIFLLSLFSFFRYYYVFLLFLIICLSPFFLSYVSLSMPPPFVSLLCHS